MEISVVYCDIYKRTTFSRDYYVPINETMHLLDNTIKNDTINKGIFTVNHEKYLNENNTTYWNKIYPGIIPYKQNVKICNIYLFDKMHNNSRL